MNKIVLIIASLMSLTVFGGVGAAQSAQVNCSPAYPYPIFLAPNDTSTGTVLYKAADQPSGNAIVSPHTNAAGAVGIVVGNAGTGGSACITSTGSSPLYMDGTATLGHCVIRSTTTDGEGHDTAAACTSAPSSGEWWGEVTTGCTGANCLAVVTLKGGFATPTAGSGTVTSLATSCGVTGGTITTSGTISGAISSSTKSTSYTLVAGDCGSIVQFSATATATVPQAGTTGFLAGYYARIQNTSSVAITVSTSTSTFYGKFSGSSFSLPAGQIVLIVSDGTNWDVAENVGSTTVLISTSGPVTDPGGTSVYQFNNASGALTFNLAAGVPTWTRCYRNATGKSGVITIAVTTSNTIDLNGTNGTSGTGTLVSGGASGDAICLVSDATNHWYAYAQKGTWTNN